MHEPTEDEPYLLRAFRRKDRAAFDALFARHAPGVFAFTRRQTGSCDDAEEIVTETFAAAFASAPGFLGRARLKTYLLAIARRRVLDRVRRPRVSTERLDDSLALASEQLADRPVLAAIALQSALTALDPAQREAFLLVVAQGLTYIEAASVVKTPVGTVKWRVSEATRKLRAHLESLEEEERNLR